MQPQGRRGFHQHLLNMGNMAGKGPLGVATAVNQSGCKEQQMT